MRVNQERLEHDKKCLNDCKVVRKKLLKIRDDIDNIMTSNHPCLWERHTSSDLSVCKELINDMLSHSVLNVEYWDSCVRNPLFELDGGEWDLGTF
jgi:hypothetical protein